MAITDALGAVSWIEGDGGAIERLRGAMGDLFANTLKIIAENQLHNKKLSISEIRQKLLTDKIYTL